MIMLRPADDASLQFVRTLIIIECGQKKMDWQAHNYFVIFYAVTRFTIDSQTIYSKYGLNFPDFYVEKYIEVPVNLLISWLNDKLCRHNTLLSTDVTQHKEMAILHIFNMVHTD